MIYFVRDPAAGLVKIGYSANPWRRVEAIQTASPGHLLVEAIVAGDRSEEAALHVRFREQRQRGEWFVWGGPIAAYVAGLECAPRPLGKRDPVKTQIYQAMRRLGFGKAYACELQRGVREWPLRIAVAVWQESGHKVGPIVNAPDEDIRVVAKYVALERAPAERRAAA